MPCNVYFIREEDPLIRKVTICCSLICMPINMIHTWPFGITSSLSLLSLLVLLFSFLLFCLFCRSRKRKIPTNWPVLGMLPGLLSNLHRLQDFCTDVLEASDRTFFFRGPWLLGMNFFLTCEPANANHVFNENFSNYPKGGDFSDIFDVFGDGIFSADSESWRVQRRMAHAHMRHHTFRLFVAKCSREKTEKVLLCLLNRLARLNKVVDLQDVFMRFTFDATCTLVFGVDPGCLTPDFPTVQFAKAMDDVERGLLHRHLVPKIWWKITRRLRIGEERTTAMGIQVIDQFIAEIISDRRANSGEDHKPQAQADLLTSYMQTDRSMDDNFLRDTLLSFLAAGKDTTGAALAWFFWLVATHPTVESNILKELERLLHQTNRSSRGEMIVFDYEEISDMVYLQASLFETLRLFPPVPYNHKSVMQQDVLPSGHKVGRGATILTSTYAMGRMKDIWGEDCLEFKPERWIMEEGKVKHEPSYKFLAFHTGPRTCLGRDTSLMQIKVVASAVIYNFAVEVVEGHVVEPNASIVLKINNGLMVKLRRRRSN